MEERYDRMMCEILDRIWELLSRMMIELRGKNIDVPNAVKVSLNGAKILLTLCKHHPRLAFEVSPTMLDSVQGLCVGCCGADIVARIICELKTSQDLIMIKATSVLSEDSIKEWQKRLDELWREVGEIYAEVSSSRRGD